MYILYCIWYTLISFLYYIAKSINPLNAELNPVRHLLALVGARHIVHVSRIRVNPLNTELNPVRHLLALVAARHIVHVSRIRVNVSKLTMTLLVFNFRVLLTRDVVWHVWWITFFPYKICGSSNKKQNYVAVCILFIMGCQLIEPRIYFVLAMCLCTYIIWKWGWWWWWWW